MSLSKKATRPVVVRDSNDRRQANDGPPHGKERRMADADRRRENNMEYVTFYVAGQLLGIPVQDVQEVLSSRAITQVPLAPKAVAGLLNLRGQIVTAVDLGKRLGLQEQTSPSKMSIVVNHEGELFSLLVDSVGDVLAVNRDSFSEPPATLDDCWKQCCRGVYQLQRGLLIIIDVSSTLKINSQKTTEEKRREAC